MRLEKQIHKQHIEETDARGEQIHIQHTKETGAFEKKIHKQHSKDTDALRNQRCKSCGYANKTRQRSRD